MEQYGIKCSDYVLNKGGGTKNSKMKGYALRKWLGKNYIYQEKFKPTNPIYIKLGGTLIWSPFGDVLHFSNKFSLFL